jgi:hypothetical protein
MTFAILNVCLHRSQNKCKILTRRSVFEAKKKYYQCIICPEHQPQVKRDALRHEEGGRHIQALRARDDNDDATASTQSSSFRTSSVHGPAIAGDYPDQLYHSYAPEPSRAMQEAILLGALETTDQNYQVAALDLGALLTMPSGWHSGSDVLSDDDDESSAAPSSDNEGSISDGM